MDVRIVNNGQNSGPIYAANVRHLNRADALVVVQVNASGDIVNPGGSSGGGGGGDGAILDGANSAIKATVKSYANSSPLAVTLVNASGDTYNAGGGSGGSGGDGAILDGANNAVKATVLTGQTARPDASSNPLVVQFADDPTRQIGTPSPPVTGIQVLGGSIGARVQPSGDFPVRLAAVTVGIGVTGDVSTTPKFGQIWPVLQQNVLGVYVTGGSGMGTAGVTGDVYIRPSTSLPNSTNFPVSGDVSISDGSNRTIKGTVRSYTRGNPQAVVLVNVSGDDYSPSPKSPVILTASGRVANQGSNTIVSAVTGRRIKITSYELQGDGDNARAFLASGASGTQLTTEWELAQREGVVKGISGVGGGYLTATAAGALLSLECSSSQGMKYSVNYYTEDAN